MNSMNIEDQFITNQTNNNYDIICVLREHPFNLKGGGGSVSKFDGEKKFCL